jgi:hypothetical protein
VGGGCVGACRAGAVGWAASALWIGYMGNQSRSYAFDLPLGGGVRGEY